jgi:hypothetical protein
MSVGPFFHHNVRQPVELVLLLQHPEFDDSKLWGTLNKFASVLEGMEPWKEAHVMTFDINKSEVDRLELESNMDNGVFGGALRWWVKVQVETDGRVRDKGLYEFKSKLALGAAFMGRMHTWLGRWGEKSWTDASAVVKSVLSKVFTLIRFTTMTRDYLNKEMGESVEILPGLANLYRSYVIVVETQARYLCSSLAHNGWVAFPLPSAMYIRYREAARSAERNLVSSQLTNRRKAGATKTMYYLAKDTELKSKTDMKATVLFAFGLADTVVSRQTTGQGFLKTTPDAPSGDQEYATQCLHRDHGGRHVSISFPLDMIEPYELVVTQPGNTRAFAAICPRTVVVSPYHVLVHNTFHAGVKQPSVAGKEPIVHYAYFQVLAMQANEGLRLVPPEDESLEKPLTKRPVVWVAKHNTTKISDEIAMQRLGSLAQLPEDRY